MKQVYLVTGAAGHLGSAVLEKLRRRDCLIRGLVLPGEPAPPDDRITWYRGDVTRPETLVPFFEGLSGPEAVVLHMAGIVTIQDEVSPSVRNVNVNGTLHILEKCFQYRIRRLVYISSVHAIPEPPEVAVVREISSFSGSAVEGTYAVTKAEATRLVLEAGRHGLDVVVVHPSGILGPGDTGTNHLNQLLRMYLHRRLPFGVRGGYDLVDVRDVAEGILSAAEQGRAGECYLLTNRYATVPELLDLLRAAAGRSHRPPCLPLWLARAALPLTTLLARLTRTRPLFTRCSLKVLGTRSRFSHEKATRELNYRPRDLWETVAETAAALQGTQQPLHR